MIMPSPHPHLFSSDSPSIICPMAEEEQKHHHHFFHHHRDESPSEVDPKKEEKHHKHKEHLGELGALAAGAYALVSHQNSISLISTSIVFVDKGHYLMSTCNRSTRSTRRRRIRSTHTSTRLPRRSLPLLRWAALGSHSMSTMRRRKQRSTPASRQTIQITW